MAKKAAVLLIILVSLMVFGYTQYAFATQISAKITQSKLLEKSDKGSLYSLELEFDNPSLLILSAGKTEFTIIANDKTLGEGELDSFILPALGKTTASGTWLRDQVSDSDNSQVKISGVTKYQLLFASIDVPFTYYPTYDQTRKFIQDA